MIINNSSIALFYYNFLQKSKIKDNYQLIAGFFDQIAHFTKFGLKDDLGLIMMENVFFSFYINPKTNLRIVFKCDKIKYEDSKTIKKSLDIIAKKISDKFYDIFKQDLEKFDGNVSRFKVFNKTIDDIFSTK